MKVLLRTFGCRANHYDSEVVRAMVQQAGHQIVDAAEDADVAVFNSCAVTLQAEAELRKAVRQAARRNPALKTTIMGCASALPSLGGQRALHELPTVTDLIAGADLPLVAASIGVPLDAGLRTRAQSGTRALLRIQEGCDDHCTFCATTLARGANRSRPITEVTAEALALAESHAEIVLTGIHIGRYGVDIGSSLGALVEQLIREVDAVRFRLTSVEATEVDPHLADLLTGVPRRLAPSLHAPLQSGSDRVLKRMGRHWQTAATYAQSVETLTSRTSVFGLGADVICGFPGETDEDHASTVSLVHALPFTYLHVFPFSARPGTAAERLADPVPPSVAISRVAELRAIGSAKAVAYAGSRNGGRADVIVLGSAGTVRQGMTEDYLTVSVADGPLARGARFEGYLIGESGGLMAHSIPT